MFAKISGNVSKESIHPLEMRRGFTTQKKGAPPCSQNQFQNLKQFQILIIIIIIL